MVPDRQKVWTDGMTELTDGRTSPKLYPSDFLGGITIGFQDQLSLNAGQKYCRMLQESILQYFLPSLSYNLALRPLFCLFLNGRFRQVLLYILI